MAGNEEFKRGNNMKKYDFLYFDIGADKILKEFGRNKLFLLKTGDDVRRIVQLSAKNLKNENGIAFLNGLTNICLYRLCLLQRTTLNASEEHLLALFGRVLAKKNVADMNVNAVKVLMEDFTAHLFYDITYDKKSKYVANRYHVPLELLKIVGYSSLNIEKELENESVVE